MLAGRFIRWSPGAKGSRVLIDAVHAAPPRADAYTGEIAQAAATALGGHCIVATVSRTKADLNRPRRASNAPAIDEYRATIRKLLADAGLLSQGRLARPVLHLAVHGMTDNHGYDVEIGTRKGASCSEEVRGLAHRILRDWARRAVDAHRPLKIVLDERFIGDPSKIVHRLGDPMSGYEGYGANFNTIQLEFARWLRVRHRASVVNALIAIGRAFQGKKGSGTFLRGRDLAGRSGANVR